MTDGKEKAEPQVFLDGRVVLHAGDCLDVLDAMPENSVDAVVTDPPYHFDTIVKRFGSDKAAPAQFGTDGAFARASAGFMGKQWDGGDIAFRPDTWAKVLRVLKPGGHLAAFSAPKCAHKMAFGIEAAGFEVRDRIVHMHDTDDAVIAFLDSLSPAQADALFRLADRFGSLGDAFWCFGSGFPKSHDVAKAIDKLKGKRGKSTPTGRPVKRMIPGADQHKRGWEKTGEREYQPGEYLPGSTEAAQWQGWGTALKPAYEPIVIARKPIAEKSVAAQVLATGTGAINVDAARIGTERLAPQKAGTARLGTFERGDMVTPEREGRFPANLTHDGSPATTSGFPQDAGASAARFFYTAKADGNDRLGSGHPTVKPLDLMQWLCRMLTPPDGTILDPFAGTGTTGEAAFREGFSAILIEREAEYRADIARRMEHAVAGPAGRRHAALRARAERMKEKQKRDPGDDLLAALDT